MKILNLQANNILKLTAIDITPTDNMVLVIGKNGAGKSSILDCIVMALKGGREIPEVPIKKGADKGKIRIDLGEFILTKSFTKDNNYLKVEAKDGSKVESPQKFLDKIVGNVSFDPLSFLNNEKLKQRNLLLEIIGVNVDEIDKKEKALRDERTVIGREQTKADALYKSLPYHDGIDHAVEIGVDELSGKLVKAMEFNNKLATDLAFNEQIKVRAQQEINETTRIENQITELQKRMVEIKGRIESIKKTYRAEKELLSSLAPIDITALQTKIEELGITNRQVRENNAHVQAKTALSAITKDYDALTRQIDTITQERKTLLSSASMPVDGLDFDDGGLLFNGIPLDQASDGEKLMVSLGISMALNPTLRVLRIKDGSLLDESNRAIIRSIIKDKDYQLWFESVGDKGDVGILIEEGEIVSVDGKKPSRTPPTSILKHMKEDKKEEVKGPAPVENKELEEDW